MHLSPSSREDRFTALYARHYRAVRAYAWRRGPDEADDVVAETFLVAWRRLEELPDDCLPWLFAVARNVRLNMARQERRRRSREERGASTQAPEPFTASLENGSALQSGLARLSEPDREVLMLAAWESLDRAQMAQALGCSKAAAAVRLHRARRRLAAVLATDAARSRLNLDRSRGGLDEC
jgi:RNA polymerase sigma-70 factor (ECF subfamily)